MRTSQLIICMACASLLAMAAVGCGTMKIPAYQGQASALTRSGESQGLKVTLDPIVDKERGEKYFKVEPQKSGFAIIHLRAENKAADAAWLLSLENMRLVHSAQGGGATAANQEYKSDMSAANALSVTALVLTSPLLMGVSGKMLSNRMIVEKNFVDKEWRNQTLSPGQRAEGFVYFRLGQQTNWIGNRLLRIDTLDTRS